MSNSSFPGLPVAEQSALPTDVINQGNDRLERLFGWWYKFTMPPRATATDSFLRRETDRKARQLSTITFFFIAVLLIFLYPAMFQIRATFYTDLGAIFITSSLSEKRKCHPPVSNGRL